AAEPASVGSAAAGTGRIIIGALSRSRSLVADFSYDIARRAEAGFLQSGPARLLLFESAPHLAVATPESAPESSNLYELELLCFQASKLKALVFSWECRCQTKSLSSPVRSRLGTSTRTAGVPDAATPASKSDEWQSLTAWPGNASSIFLASPATFLSPAVTLSLLSAPIQRGLAGHFETRGVDNERLAVG